MYVIAVIADIASLIPILNIFSGVIAAITLGIVGLETGVNLFKPKNLPATLLTIVVEEIPIVSMLPAWTIRVFLAKRAKKAEEAQGGEE